MRNSNVELGIIVVNLKLLARLLMTTPEITHENGENKMSQDRASCHYGNLFRTLKKRKKLQAKSFLIYYIKKVSQNVDLLLCNSELSVI